MGFPVTTDKGETVVIEEKLGTGELLDAEGNVYFANSGFDALKVELSEAAEAAGEVVDAVEKTVDEVGDVVDAAGDVLAGFGIGDDDEPDATPAATAKAEEVGVDLTSVEGSGQDGRILVSDVDEAAEAAEEE
jgi:pyruvate/2-oxoglutarate dehydrogenase complex dihydrolipoamide acyltransferase (E2) component